jgi:hypothetical protein
MYDFDYSEGYDVEGPENFRLLAASLNGNTKLKRLEVNHYRYVGEWSAIANDCFCKLLCKTTSIESVYNYNSNHTLEYMSGFPMSSHLTQYFELNENGDKNKLYATRC